MMTNRLSRRDVLSCGALSAVAATLPTQSFAARSVHGVVYHDRSKAGSRSPDDPGLPGILVSNGIDNALTGADGRWELPFRAGSFVFPIKPNDWIAPQTNSLPNPGVLMGQQPPSASLDFGLQPQKEPRRFSVALLADTQPQSVLELGYLRDGVLPVVAQSHAVFAINHGDVVFDRPELYERYISLIAATGMPWHHCPGNHDMDRRSDGSGCFETWHKVFGPTHYAFEYGGALFILLNNVAPMPAGQLTSTDHDYRGHISWEQLAFVRNLLDRIPKDQLVVMSMHIPLVGWEDPADPSGHTDNAVALLQLLSGRPNTLSLAGHTHTTEHHYLGQESGFAGPGLHHHHVLTAASGSWWSGPFDPAGQPFSVSRDGTPKGIHVLEVDNGRYTTRFVPAGHAGNQRVSVWLEGATEDLPADGARQGTPMHLRLNVGCADVKTTSLAVNIFDGGPRTKMTCSLKRVGNGSPQCAHSLNLTRQVAVDACLADSYRRNRTLVKPWVEASKCSHLWSAQLPADLESGSYQATFNITDEYDQPYAAIFIFEVSA